MSSTPLDGTPRERDRAGAAARERGERGAAANSP